MSELEAEQPKLIRTKAGIALLSLSIAAAGIWYGVYQQVDLQVGPLKSQMPMVILKDKTALHKVVTYDDKPITTLMINLKPKFRQAFHNVYLNYRSQFVYNDGRPILYKNEPLFWNLEGNVVDYNYQVIDEGNIFYIDERAMSHGTAMTLLELKSIAKATYHKGVRDNVRMEHLRVLKDVTN